MAEIQGQQRARHQAHLTKEWITWRHLLQKSERGRRTPQESHTFADSFAMIAQTVVSLGGQKG
jgi:hypothetical protein